MHHIVRRCEGLALETRDVVVLDVVPFHIGDVEEVEGGEPLAGLAEADLDIDRGVSGGPGAVVLDQRCCAKMAGLDRAEPSGLALRRESRVNDIRGAVRNVFGTLGKKLLHNILHRACGYQYDDLQAPRTRRSGWHLRG